MALVLPGLMTGRQNTYQMKYLTFLCIWCYYSISMHFSWFYQVKSILRWVLEVHKFWMPFLLGQSLLLSTIVLNDVKLILHTAAAYIYKIETPRILSYNALFN